MEHVGGWCHITARGNERRDIFRDNRDRSHFPELSRYVHLNPVRVGRLGLGKAERGAGRAGAGPAPETRQVQERIRRTAQKNGLFAFSSATVVAGPWPGQSRVASGRVKI